MSHRTLLLCITYALLVIKSAPAGSQSTTPLLVPGEMEQTHSVGRTPDSSQYDRRALRFESHRAAIRVLQGNEGTVVGKTQWFRSFDLASIVSSSDRAVAEAGDFNRYRTPGMWMLSLGIVAVAADAILVRANGHPSLATSTLGIGGFVLAVSGLERLDRASEVLSKSLWWYNRDLRK